MASDRAVLQASVGVLKVALAGDATSRHRVRDQPRDWNLRFTIDAQTKIFIVKPQTCVFQRLQSAYFMI
jgi:hypothetical protein